MTTIKSGNDPTTQVVVTLKTIEAALKLIDTKKGNLKKAYDDLLHVQQPHSSSLLSSFSLSWSLLDTHFTSLQSQLTHRFHHLQSLESKSSTSRERVDSVPIRQDLTVSDQPRPDKGKDPSLPSSSNLTSHERVDSEVSRPELKPWDGSDLPPAGDPSASNPPSPGDNPVSHDRVKKVVPRPLLVSMCEKMDGKGLRDYITENAKDRIAIRNELTKTIRVAPDPGAMVLDAMEGFYPVNGRGQYLSRKSCLDLLVVIRHHKPNFSHEVRERARKLAFEWKKKVNLKGDSPIEALGFLHLVVAYKLENEFDVSVLLDYFVISSRFREAKALCKEIGLGDKAADLIQKLIDKGKTLPAVKYIFEFGLTDKFQPITLLKEHLMEAKTVAEKAYKDENNSLKAQNDARSREINALKSVVKVIDQYKLESDFPWEDLEKRLELLKKPKADSKRPAPSPVNKSLQKTKKALPHQNGNKRPRTTTTAGPEAVPIRVTSSSSTIHPMQQSHMHPAGLLSAANLYGFVGTVPPTAPYAGSSSGHYGLAGAAMGFPGNPDPAGAYLYTSESQMPSNYYDRPVAYGSYGYPPQYHAAYYPQ